MRLIIREFEVFSVAIPFRVPFHIAKGLCGDAQQPARRILLRLHTEMGVVGVGEAAPMEAWTSETFEQVLSTLCSHYAPLLRGEDLLNRRRIHALLDQAIRGSGQMFARCAVDLASFDAAGKALGVPVANLLGGALQDRLPSLWGIGIAEPETMRGAAVAKEAEGFRLIKVKIGNDPDQDVERVRIIREALRPQTMVCADANEGYDRAQALRVCRALDELGLLYIEQPLPREDLEGMAHLRRLLRTPLMVDESVMTRADLLRAIVAGAGDFFFYKLDKSGGIGPTVDLIAMAESAGLVCTPGAMLNTGIGTAALAHVAAATGARYPGGFNGPLVLEDDLVEAEDLRYDRGHLLLPTGPGLGVRLDEAALRKYRLDV